MQKETHKLHGDVQEQNLSLQILLTLTASKFTYKDHIHQYKQNLLFKNTILLLPNLVLLEKLLLLFFSFFNSSTLIIKSQLPNNIKNLRPKLTWKCIEELRMKEKQRKLTGARWL
jgi:hypothetical protein